MELVETTGLTCDQINKFAQTSARATSRRDSPSLTARTPAPPDDLLCPSVSAPASPDYLLCPSARGEPTSLLMGSSRGAVG